MIATGCTLKEEHPLRLVLNSFFYHFNHTARDDFSYQQKI